MSIFIKFVSVNFRSKINIIIAFWCCVFLYACKSSPKTKSIEVKEKRTGSNAAVDKVIKVAYGYEGTKYKFGGIDKNGMDCSGLMHVSFKEVGIVLPRTSSAQSTYGERIYIGEIRAGDLIFFATSDDPKKITHVGLVTEVSGDKDIKFIHATTQRGVCEDWLSQPYYKARYVKAVRLFN